MLVDGLAGGGNPDHGVASVPMDAGEPEAPATTEAPAIDEARVTEWFGTHVPGSVPPLSFRLIAGGRSNLTFRVTDRSGRSYALRRPPVSHVLPTAHDMGREYRVLTALAPTPVPVPATYDICLDEEVNGRPFYVMDFVEGHILRDAEAAEAAFPPDGRRPIAEHMADTLAALHAVDVDAVGLGDLGRREGYVERQVRRWSTQYAEMVGPGEEDDLVGRVAGLLAASVPPQREATIVHGDYRLDNVVLDDEGRVKAILDWEICTLGDPLADLGTLLMYWTEPADDLAVLGSRAPTTAPGFASRAELLTRYAKTSGRDVSDIGFYTAFAAWRLACILQGVYTRSVAGAGGGDPNSVEGFPTTIHHLAERAAADLEGTP